MLEWVRYHWFVTPKEQKFCIEYAKQPDAKASGLKAGYSEKYADRNMRKVLQKPAVVAEIKRLRERINERAEKSATDVVNEFSKIAFCDRVDFLKPDPHIPGDFIYKSPDELTKEQRAIVEKVTYNIHEFVIVHEEKDKDNEKIFRQEYNYVLSDKAKALEQMGRHFGIFDDKLRISGSQINPFLNVSNAQLKQLKSAWVQTMSDPKLIEGQYKEIKTNGS